MIRWRVVLIAVVLAGAGRRLHHHPRDGFIPDVERGSPFDDADAACVTSISACCARTGRGEGHRLARRGEVGITSGWRSRAYQQRLLTDAVYKYRSLGEARRFVSTPDNSAQVVGKAVDIGPTDAADWMIQHGDVYGLPGLHQREVALRVADRPRRRVPTPAVRRCRMTGAADNGHG